MKKVTATQDNDGHWYVIPSELIQEFNDLLEKSDPDNNKDWDDYEQQLIDKFSDYMTGGDLNEVQLYADI